MNLAHKVLNSPEIISSQQTIVIVSISDAISLEALRTTPRVEVTLSSSSIGDAVPLNAAYRQVNPQLIVFYGRPDLVLPQSIDDAEEVTLNIRVSANQYLDTSYEQVYVGADLKVTEQSLDSGLTFALLNAPLLQHNFALTPVPVGLQGQVIQDNDPFQSASNASITISQPPTLQSVSSDTNGRFRFTEIPTMATIELSIEFDGITSTVNHLVDYATPLNKITVSVNG